MTTDDIIKRVEEIAAQADTPHAGWLRTAILELLAEQAERHGDQLWPSNQMVAWHEEARVLRSAAKESIDGNK